LPIGEEITSFPPTVTITAQDFATALGVEIGNIGFGDSFKFRGTATNNQGTVYNYERLAFDEDTLTLTGGNNSDDYLDQAGYRNAFIFEFSIACPGYDSSTVAGTYLITVDDFEGIIDDGVFDIIEGPGVNQFTMINFYGHPEMYNVIIDIDPNTGDINVERQAAWHCDNFGCGFGEGRVDGVGLAFTCVGALTFNLEHTVDAGSFGSYALKAEKM
tara:strand:+ start:5099 stop:5746 length:648 start_codon:yes stop_codon:yes gene_type:complete